MFRNLSGTLVAANAANSGKTERPTLPGLRSDIYVAIDQVKPWLIGDPGPATAGDGVSYSGLMNIIQKHFPDAKMGSDLVGNAEGEAAAVVRGITNMILEMSRWDGMISGVAMKTWIDALGEAYVRAAAANQGSRPEMIRRGISKGVEMTDATLITKEFAVRLQLISLLKNANARLYGAGSAEARRGDSLWSSRFI